MSPLIAAALAIVVSDHTPLLAAPDSQGPKQAVLSKGDWLEIRGQRRDYLKVYLHRSERPGFVQRSRVQVYPSDASIAPGLRAIIGFLRDAPHSESLGIAYVALYLRLAPKGGLDAPLFDALGTLAQRLARRANQETSGRRFKALVAHMDVASSYGVRFVSFSHEDRTRVCYDGEAFRRVLALKGATDELRTNAVLALSDPQCIDPTLRPLARRQLLEWSLSLAKQVDPTTITPYLGNRLRLRRSSIASRLAYERARQKKFTQAAELSREALDALLRVDKANLARDDLDAYMRSAVLVAASRWSREPVTRRRGRGPWIGLTEGRPGETCVELIGAKVKTKAHRCTYGLTWPSSIQRAPGGRQLTIAVQHLAGWLEAWVFIRGKDGWRIETLTPSVTEPELGYVEVAGWTPGGRDLLLVREAVVDGSLRRRFSRLGAKSMKVKVEARTLTRFVTFRRWHSPDWKRGTLALRGAVF